MTLPKRLCAIVVAATAALLIASVGSAVARDRNNDRIPDRWEKKNDLSLKHKQTKKDQDRDGLRNRNEWRSGTDPHNPDTDDDGVGDDDENAGKVVSFDPATGQLTIDPFQGDEITGLVTSDTEIECENEQGDDNDDQGEDEHGDDEGVAASDDEGPGDDDGPGGDNEGPGSDNSGPGNGDEDEDEDGNCSTADLVPDAVVHEAELDVTSQGAVFEEIELVK
jgi:hypothetical protein